MISFSFGQLSFPLLSMNLQSCKTTSIFVFGFATSSLNSLLAFRNFWSLVMLLGTRSSAEVQLAAPHTAKKKNQLRFTCAIPAISKIPHITATNIRTISIRTQGIGITVVSFFRCALIHVCNSWLKTANIIDTSVQKSAYELLVKKN